jgi:hypothetical protein
LPLKDVTINWLCFPAVIGKLADLEKPGTRKPGEKTLDLPNQGRYEGIWVQNSSKLREAMSEV